MTFFRKLTLLWKLFDSQIEKYAARSGRTKESGLIPILLLGAGVAGYLGFKFFKNLPCSLSDFECIGISVAGWLIKVTFGALAVAAEYIFKGVAAVMGWTLANFLAIPVTPGAEGVVPIVTEGWDISRMLVNSILLLVLVFIGLATILRIQSYQMQRTLPSLIIIALLVNFSGILVGFLVDIANLITNFFLQAVQNIEWDIPWPGKAQPSGTDLAEIVALSIAKILYYLVAILIFMVIIIVFFVRVFVLWTLTILAPLAFAAFILPATRRWWSQWLNALIQWAFVGVPMSFFLFLSGLALSLSATEIVSEDSVDEAGAFAGFLGPFAALFLLFVGVAISLSLAPAFAQGAARFGRGVGMVAGGVLLRDVVRKRIAGSEKRRQNINRLAEAGTPEWGGSAHKFNPLGYMQRGAANAAGWAQRGVGNVATKVILEPEARRASQAGSKAQGQNVHQNLHDARQADSLEELVAILRVMATRGQLREAMNPDIVGERNVLRTNELVRGYGGAWQQRDSDLIQALERAGVGRPELVGDFRRITHERTRNAADANDRADAAAGLTPNDLRKGLRTFEEKIMEGVRSPEDMRQLRPGWYNVQNEAGEQYLMEAAHEFWAGPQFQQAATAFGRAFVDALENTKRNAEWYVEPTQRGTDRNGNPIYHPRNPRALQFFGSTAAQGLGVTPVQRSDGRFLDNRQEINEVIRNAIDAARRARGQADAAARSADAIQEEITNLRAEIDRIRPSTPPYTSPRIREIEEQIERLEQELQEAEARRGEEEGGPETTGGTGDEP